MKKTLGLAALAMTGCIFVRSHQTDPLLLRGQSERFEYHGNHVTVQYEGPLFVDGLMDDYIVLQSYGPRSLYEQKGMFVSSGDSACVLGIKLKFDIENDNDGNTHNNILKVTAERCR